MRVALVSASRACARRTIPPCTSVSRRTMIELRRAGLRRRSRRRRARHAQPRAHACRLTPERGRREEVAKPCGAALVMRFAFLSRSCAEQRRGIPHETKGPRTHARTPARTHTRSRTHARTHSHARMHAHTVTRGCEARTAAAPAARVSLMYTVRKSSYARQRSIRAPRICWSCSTVFGAASPVAAQMWKGWAQSRCRCGSGEPSPGADLCEGASSGAVQMQEASLLGYAAGFFFTLLPLCVVSVIARLTATPCSDLMTSRIQRWCEHTQQARTQAPVSRLL